MAESGFPDPPRIRHSGAPTGRRSLASGVASVSDEAVGDDHLDVVGALVGGTEYD
jgi:hypothetical protein